MATWPQRRLRLAFSISISIAEPAARLERVSAASGSQSDFLMINIIGNTSHRRAAILDCATVEDSRNSRRPFRPWPVLRNWPADRIESKPSKSATQQRNNNNNNNNNRNNGSDKRKPLQLPRQRRHFFGDKKKEKGKRGKKKKNQQIPRNDASRSVAGRRNFFLFFFLLSLIEMEISPQKIIKSRYAGSRRHVQVVR